MGPFPPPFDILLYKAQYIINSINTANFVWGEGEGLRVDTKINIKYVTTSLFVDGSVRISVNISS